MQSQPDLAKELAFTAEIFRDDAKNYHTWAYRAWLISHFGISSSLSPTTDADDGIAAATASAASSYIDEIWHAELGFTTDLIGQDARNNSAWNHRWLVLFGSAWATSQSAQPYVGPSLHHVLRTETE